MTTLKNLSLADLVALHTNYWLSADQGARLRLISESDFKLIEVELQTRLNALFGE